MQWMQRWYTLIYPRRCFTFRHSWSSSWQLRSSRCIEGMISHGTIPWVSWQWEFFDLCNVDGILSHGTWVVPGVSWQWEFFDLCNVDGMLSHRTIPWVNWKWADNGLCHDPVGFSQGIAISCHSRECVTRFSTSIFFHDSNPLCPLLNRHKYFWIQFCFCRDIISQSLK